jgi:hypothetical protein
MAHTQKSPLDHCHGWRAKPVGFDHQSLFGIVSDRLTRGVFRNKRKLGDELGAIGRQYLILSGPRPLAPARAVPHLAWRRAVANVYVARSRIRRTQLKEGRAKLADHGIYPILRNIEVFLISMLIG